MTLKQLKELIPIMVAFTEGKTIQVWTNNTCEDIEHPSFGEFCQYRIKPEPKYRPFKDKEECWVEMQKHQPFGWVKTMHHSYCLITYVVEYMLNGDDSIEIDSTRYSLKEAFEQFTFVDSTPFGIKEE